MQAKLSFNAGYTICKICPTFMLSLVYRGKQMRQVSPEGHPIKSDKKAELQQTTSLLHLKY